MSAAPLDFHGNVDGSQNGAEEPAGAPTARGPVLETVLWMRRSGNDALHRRPSVVLPVILKIQWLLDPVEVSEIVSAPIEESLDRLSRRIADEAVPIEEFECPHRIAGRHRTVAEEDVVVSQNVVGVARGGVEKERLAVEEKEKLVGRVCVDVPRNPARLFHDNRLSDVSDEVLPCELR